MNQRSRQTFVTAAAILTLGSSLLLSQGQDSAGITQTTIRAMNDELKRSMSDLQVKGMDRPYFIQYIVMEEDEYSSESTFGSLTFATRSQQKYAHAQVRVGDYDSDSTGTVAGAAGARGGGGGGGGRGGGGALVRTVRDNDYDGLRHTLWLLTDSTYKQAVEAIARKRASMQNRTQTEPVPDFSKETPTVSIGSRQTMEFDRPGLEQKLRDWSRIFKEYPDIQSTYVQVMARLTHRYIVSSEGTQTMQPAILISLVAGGSVQASDGMRVSSAVPFYARTFDELPSTADVTKAIRQLATDLLAIRSAPVLDKDYSGPVLISGPAAADMFGRVLAPSLTGRTGGGDLLDRLSRPILPVSFSVFDDPSLKRSGDKNLIGYYQIDDQGVPAKRVSLIEDGLFLDLVMGRKPIKERLQSNGHGRSGYPGAETAEISNMVVKVADGKSLADLKQELIKSAKAERLLYGMMIKGASLGSTIQTYKVHVADGREELVRGAAAGGISAGSLRHIQAAGNDSFVSNRLTGQQGAETPVSVVGPSVLVEEMEFRKPSGTQQKPALLTRPDISTP